MNMRNSAANGRSAGARGRRSRWMAQGSGLAIALGLGFGTSAQAAPGGIPPSVAGRESNAQAVQGTPAFPGSVAWGAQTANSDTINVDTPAAIINWTTLDTATLADTAAYVNFIPEGTSLTFRGPASDYVVLNRVFGTADGAGNYRGIAINGQVTSTLLDGTRGGQIWFYSPGGILIGNAAAINVGSLVLTTSDVNAITAGQIDFAGAPQDFSSVYIDSGATISLTQDGSYFAVVAPTIEQHGTVSVNGSTTYFLTDSGTILLDGIGGLDARVIDLDADPLTIEGAAANGNFLVHTGSTGGVASLQVQDVNGVVLSADPHFIEFLAPNSALTLQISGAVGYEAAAAAAVGSNGSIIISGTNDPFLNLPAGVDSPASSLTVASTSFTSSTAITGFDDVSIMAGAGETISLGTDGWGQLSLSVTGNSVSIGALAGGALRVDGNLSVSDGRSDRAGVFALNAQSDPTGLLAPGSVTIGGNFSINTSLAYVGSPIQPEVSDDITVTVAGGASLSVSGQMDLNTSTYSTRIEGTNPYQASEIQSGSVTLSVGEDATLTVAGRLTISTDARRGEGTYSYGASSTAGDVDIDFLGSTVEVGGLSIYGYAEASPGSYANLSGATYDGIGGTVTIDIVGGAADLGSVLVDTSGLGGRGGAASQSGAGIGGDVSIVNSGSLSVTDLTIVADGVGQAGTNASFSGAAGSGGEGRGGAIVVDTSSTIIGLASIDLSATGNGGNGGAGYYGSGPYPGGAGGAGFGGSIRLTASGTGTTLTGLSTLALDVTGTGGDGAAGLYSFGGGGTNGYSGGNGTGGSLTIEARTGATLEIPVGSDLLSANGFGGAGGSGGDSYSGPASTGGNGGNGYGGSLSLVAQGGTLVGSNIDLTSTGTGGAAGLGGYVYNGGSGGYYGANGANGAGAGGSVSLSALEGSPGIISLGAISIDASGFAGGGDITVPTTGGAITITDASTDPAGLITMASLNAVSAGGSGTPGDFTMAGDSGPITINGIVNVDVDGHIVFDFDGTGQLDAAGATTLNAAGSIIVTHSNNALPTLSIDSGGDFTATAGGNFTIGSGAVVNSGGFVAVRAEGAIDVNDIRGVGSMELSAGLSNTVNNASVSGTPTVFPLGALSLVVSGLTITSGSSNAGAEAVFDPNFNVLITGSVTSTGFIEVDAGGSAVFQSGSSTISDNGMLVRTGDDIIIGSGALVEAAANPATSVNPAFLFSNPNNLFLLAGDINGIELVSPIQSPISSIASAGTINSNGFAAVLTANAIDGAGGVLTGASIAADINDAPGVSVAQRDDNGLLTDPCLEGSICLGTISATNRIEIGQASNNDVIALFVSTGDVGADTILITTRQDISFGTDGIPSALNATTQFSAVSVTGDVNLLDATITSDLIQISAAGSLLGSASLISANDIGITVTGDINAALIDTGGQLTTVSGIGGGFETTYAVPGSIIVGSLVQGGAVGVEITAGGNISLGSITTPTQAVTLTANNGSVYLGTTSVAGTGSIDILAQSIEFDDLAATGAITLTSTVGSISGGLLANRPFAPTVPFGGTGSLTAGGAVSLSSAGDITVGDATAGTSLLFDALGAITAGTAAATNDITLTGTSVAIAGAATSGTGASIALRATGVGGGANAGSLDTNRGDIVVQADGDIVLGSATTGLADPANAPVAGTIALLAGGNITAATAAGTSFVAGEDIAMSAGGVATLGSLLAGDDIDIAASSVLLTSATTLGTGPDLSAIDFTSGVISRVAETLPGSSIRITVTGLAEITGNVAAAGDYFVTGGSIALGSGTHSAGRGIGLLATTGDISGSAGLLLQSNSDGSGTESMTLVSDNGTISLTGSTLVGGTAADRSLVLVQTASGLALGDVNALALANPGSTSLAITGATTLGDLVLTNNFATAISGGALTIGDVTVGGAGQGIGLYAGGTNGDILVGALQTNGGDVLVSAGGSLVLASASTGAGTPTTGSIGLVSGGNIGVTGTLVSGEDIGVASLGDVSLVTLSAGDDITVDAAGAVALVSASTSGAGSDGSALSFAMSSVGLTGSIAFVTETTTLAGSNIQIDAGTNVAASGTLTAANNLIVTAGLTPTLANVVSGAGTTVSGQTVTFTSGTVGGDLTLVASGGDVDATGAVTVGGGIAIAATGDVGFDTLAAPSGNFTVSAGGDIVFANASASADLVMDAGGAIAGSGAAQAGGIASFFSGAGGIDLATLIAPTAVLLADAGPVRVSQSTVDLLDLSGSDIFVRETDSLILSATATAGAIDVRTGADLTVQGAQATGAITLAADGGSLVVQGSSAGSGVPVAIGQAIDLIALADLSLAGAVSAQQGLAMTAGGTVSIDAVVTGQTITSLSADLDIGAAGQFGSIGLTTDILVSSDGSSPMTLGGDGTATGFALGDAEVGRIFGNGSLTFDAIAPTSGGPALVIGNLAVGVTSTTNAGQIADGGTVTFSTDGAVLVNGALLVSGASANTGLEILAGQAIRIDARTGNLQLADANGGFTGQLLLTATDLFAVTDEALAAIGGLTLDEINDRLAQNDGVDRPDGMIQAGSLTISTSASQVFIQNTAPGTEFADRRGFVVGSLTLTDLAGTVMPIVINGIVGQAQGVDAVAATNIQASYDPRSTINGCLIADPAGCGFVPPDPVIPTDGIQDLIDEVIVGPDELAAPPAGVLIDMAEQDEFRDDPLIDEPVTGAGNDDFWQLGGGCADGGESCPESN